MHFIISGTWGPTDPTRAMLPFIFAASAVQDGDTVTLMLFHDAVLMAVDGAGAKLVPVGPPNRYEEVVSHLNVILWACRPCVDARGLAVPSLDHRVKLGGMNEFHAAAKQPDSKVVAFIDQIPVRRIGRGGAMTAQRREPFKDPATTLAPRPMS
jgi:tRNA 2-thiouridine synthesizing protein D